MTTSLSLTTELQLKVTGLLQQGRADDSRKAISQSLICSPIWAKQTSKMWK